MDASKASDLERTTLRTVYLRLVPFCFLLYVLCCVDRINVSFAALTMNRDLGLNAYIYGLAAGAFFWGYCLLEVPSNIILQKVGARRWIARIMVSWGLHGWQWMFIGEGLPTALIGVSVLFFLTERPGWSPPDCCMSACGCWWRSQWQPPDSMA
jgi:MFS family permease